MNVHAPLTPHARNRQLHGKDTVHRDDGIERPVDDGGVACLVLLELLFEGPPRVAPPRFICHGDRNRAAVQPNASSGVSAERSEHVDRS